MGGKHFYKQATKFKNHYLVMGSGGGVVVFASCYSVSDIFQMIS